MTDPRPGGKPTSRAGARSAGTPPREVRIIGGRWKRTRLTVADRPGLRPTPDRVRETLFNWLGQDLTEWRCVDVFAGTGALGFECASRGAAQVRMFEQDAALVAQLEAIRAKLDAQAVRVTRGDGVAGLRALPPGSVDLILLDPPFASALFGPALAAVHPALGAGGYVYLEAPEAWDDESLSPYGLVVHRQMKAGAVHAHLLTRAA
ncbi:MAG: 16S rRNA (guanine(966)-N(2))-methyltransferase RsmD [Burkholderiales bacterium]|jgi:16S rRNA (guanine(966)-N(2))-methyltransferase RsmD|nr:16S rRNA (guanine(966)-N(2))-methyltransferase RsmD [Burkholderiales bacterium]